MTSGFFSYAGAPLYADGASGAPAGAPQFPTLLSGYAVRPPWKVAGIDYAVGLKSNCSVNTSTSFITNTGTQANPVNGRHVTLRTANGGTLPSGVSLNTAYVVLNASGATCQIATIAAPTVPLSLGGSPNLVVALTVPVAGTNCMPPGVSYASGQGPSPAFFNVFATGASDITNGSQASSGTINIDSYDFSFDNGISIDLDGSSGIVNVKDCYFRVGSNFQSPIYATAFPATTLNLSYTEIDGGGSSGLANVAYNTLGYCLYLVPGGTYQYCWIHHIAHPVVFGPTAKYTYQYCLMNDTNYGVQANHADGMFPGVSTDISGSVQQFSTWYQPLASVGAGSNGYPGEMDTSYFVFLQANNSLTITNLTYNNNVGIGLGSTGHMNTASHAAGAAFNEGWYINPKTGNHYSGINITNNYIDSTGIDPSGFIILEDLSGGGTISGQNYSGNISLNSGSTIAANVAGTQ